jgi:hypothetical protein
MIGKRERETIARWHETLSEDVSLVVVLSEDPRSVQVDAFAGALQAVAPRVKVRSRRSNDLEPPAILLGDAVRYHAVPLGTELQPFLYAAERFASSRREREVEPGSRRDLRLHVSAHCPFCPVAARQLFVLLEQDPRIHLSVVDVELLPEIAQRDLVRSVPTLLLGDRFRATGQLSLDAIRAAISGDDADQPDASTVEQLLSQGDANAVASMMARAGVVFQRVLDLLASPTMSSRLGAMAAMERLMETAPGLAQSAEPAIWESLERADRQARGDLLYMLGEIGTRGSLAQLHRIGERSEDQEIAEAAADAAARIVERCEGAVSDS